MEWMGVSGQISDAVSHPLKITVGEIEKDTDRE